MAASCACDATVLNHPTYGDAAAAIDIDAGPVHGPVVNAASTDSNDDADAHKSAASPSHAEAAANNGPEPAPANMRAELISGGSHEKPKTIATPAQSAAQKGLVQGLTKQSLPNESTHRDAPMAQHAGLLEQRAQ